MAIEVFMRSYTGVPDPVDDEGVANKQTVAAMIAAALSGFTGGGSGGGLSAVEWTDVTHSVAGDLALNLADGTDRVFNVDLQANVTGLAITNPGATGTMTDVRIRFTNTTGSAKTVDLTGETGIVLEDEFVSVVSVAAGEQASAHFENWVD